MSWYAVGFWSLAIVTSILFFLRQIAADIARGQAQQMIVDRAQELEQLIRTMPPVNFLEDFAKLITMADDAIEAALGKPRVFGGVEVARQSTRHLLRFLAVLAQKFDGDHRESRYAANVMWYRRTEALGPTEIEAVQHRLEFVDQGVTVAKLLGILDLDQELSTVGSNERAERDPDLRPLALPVPVTARLGNRYAVLPGAPLAVVNKSPQLCTETSDLDKMVQRSRRFYPGGKN